MVYDSLFLETEPVPAEPQLHAQRNLLPSETGKIFIEQPRIGNRLLPEHAVRPDDRIDMGRWFKETVNRVIQGIDIVPAREDPPSDTGQDPGMPSACGKGYRSTRDPRCSHHR